MAGMLALAGLTLFVLESEEEHQAIATLTQPAASVDREPSPTRSRVDTMDADMSIALATTTIEQAPPRVVPPLPPVPGPLPAPQAPAPPPATAPPVAAPAPTPTPVATSAPQPQVPRAVAQARACGLVRRAAADARVAHDWAGLLRHTSRSSCWQSERDRTKLRVKALMELHRFSNCIEVGQHFAAVDHEVARWVQLCGRRLESTP
jgi:hypothetical protein